MLKRHESSLRIVQACFLVCVIAFSLSIGGCSDTSVKKNLPHGAGKALEGIPKQAVSFAQSITTEDLKRHVYTIASDAYSGRAHSSTKITQYLRNFYHNAKIASPKGVNNYYQEIPKAYIENNIERIRKLHLRLSEIKDDANVIAYIKGSQNPDEVLIITGHMDHFGEICPTQWPPRPAKPACKKVIYNGANDNGSGTAALLEIAEAFQKAKNEGIIPRRSVAFIHFAIEEAGILGSQYYVEHPVFALKNTVFNINLDMVGRIDSSHVRNPSYVYVTDSEIITGTRLRKIHDIINKEYVGPSLEYTRKYIRSSDQWNFVKKGIPAIFYHDDVSKDYHKPTDDADKINYEVLAKRTLLAYYTAWEFANRADRFIAKKLISSK